MVEGTSSSAPIIESFTRAGASTRLIRGLRAGLTYFEFPFRTIEAAVADRTTAFRAFVRVPGVGVGTANEFLRILVRARKALPRIEKHAERPSAASSAVSSEASDTTASPRIAKRSELPSEVSGDASAEALDAFLQRRGATARVVSAIRFALGNHSYPYPTVGEFASKIADAERALYRVGGIGKKGAREIVELVSEASRPSAASSDGQRQEVFAFEGRQESEDVNDDDDRLLLTWPIEKAVSDVNHGLLCKLEKRQQDVLILRYGLAGRERLTLAVVGDRLAVTRERVRQIEANALEQLNRRCKHDCRELLDREAEKVWRSLTSGRGALRQDDLEAFHRISPEHRLLIDVVHGGLRGWLKYFAERVKGGWIAKQGPTISAPEVEKNLIRALQARSAASIDALANDIGVGVEGLRASLTLSRVWTEFAGYVVRKPVNARMRRALRAHALFGDQPLRMPIRSTELKRLYQRCYPYDQCSSRDLQLAMEEHPSLFLKMYEEGWLAVGSVGPLTSEVADGIEALDRDEEETSEGAATDTTAIGVLRGLLECKGPRAFEELRDEFDKATDGKYARSSVGPILLSSDDFVRVAPGVYCLRTLLRQQLSTPYAEKLLLSEKQLEMYCQARWGGEPQDLYAMWSPKMEHAWAKWAERNASPDLLAALLFSSDPRSWPVAAPELKRWTAMKARCADYRLAEDGPDQFIADLPEFADVVRAAAFARARGAISWMSANRVRGSRFDDRHSIAILALLIGIGVIEPAAHWQRSHTFRNESYELVDQLLTQIGLAPKSVWTPSISHFIASLISPAAGRDLGWVHRDDLELILARLREGFIGERKIAPSDDLQEAIRAVQASRAKHALNAIHERATTGHL